MINTTFGNFLKPRAMQPGLKKARKASQFSKR